MATRRGAGLQRPAHYVPGRDPDAEDTDEEDASTTEDPPLPAATQGAGPPPGEGTGESAPRGEQAPPQGERA